MQTAQDYLNFWEPLVGGTDKASRTAFLRRYGFIFEDKTGETITVLSEDDFQEIMQGATVGNSLQRLMNAAIRYDISKKIPFLKMHTPEPRSSGRINVTNPQKERFITHCLEQMLEQAVPVVGRKKLGDIDEIIAGIAGSLGLTAEQLYGDEAIPRENIPEKLGALLASGVISAS